MPPCVALSGGRARGSRRVAPRNIYVGSQQCAGVVSGPQARLRRHAPGTRHA